MRHRTMAIVCMAVILGWLPVFCWGADAASRQDELDFALKRASLELAAGRPSAAARLLRSVDLQPQAGEREALAFLLWAESEILAGNEQVAWQLLMQLRSADDGFLRGQAAAHAMGLQLVADEQTAAWTIDLPQCIRDLPGRYRKDAARGYLLQAALAVAVADSQAAHIAWEEADDGAAGAIAELLLSESALRAGRWQQAESHAHKLAKHKEAIFDGWLADWAVLARARALAPMGRLQDALSLLETVGETEHLQHFAWLLAAQMLYEAQRPAEALEFLGRVQLERWNVSLAAEAMLLASQIHLDSGNFEAAEAVVLQLEARLDAWFADDRGAPVFEREVQLDVTAWHASRTRQTLRFLAEKNILRDVPAEMLLAESAEMVVLVSPRTIDSLRTHVTLLAAYPTGLPERRLESSTAQAAAHLQSLARRLQYAESQLLERQRSLQQRQALTQKALEEWSASNVALENLQRRAAHAAQGLDQYQEALAQQESAWVAALEGRLAAWRASIDVIAHANDRLLARYPHDRVLRGNPAVDNSRQVLVVADAWLATLDTLQTTWQAAIRQRVRLILRDFEPAAAAQQVAAMQRQLETLRQRSAQLVGRLRALDGFEEQLMAQAQARTAALRTQQHAARQRLLAAVDRAQRQAALGAEARVAVYRQAARDVQVTAHFLAAQQPSAPDALQRWQRARRSLQMILSEYPQGIRADEMWYRLAEANLQHAALQYKVDLARFLESGAAEADAPLPVEDYAEALDAYAQLLERFPTSARVPEAHFQIGFLLAEMGSPEASTHHLERFLALIPEADLRRGSAALRIGDNHLQLSQRQAACSAFERAAAAADPQAQDLGLFKLGWCHYDLEHPQEARQALWRLLQRAAVADSASHARDLQPEALELMALAFAEDHEVFEAAAAMQAWGGPEWEFVVKRRMAQLFANRALFDQAIQGYQHLYQEHPNDARIAGVVEEWLRLVEVRHGAEAAHELAADLAVHFAPGSEWSQHAASDRRPFDVAPSWQSRLLEEDRQAARVDSMSLVLADAPAAAQRMAAHLRSAAVFAHQRADADSANKDALLRQAAERYERVLQGFPGSEREAETWLYLAEARAGLGDDMSAADAYAEAAAHEQADRSIVVQASLGELVVLDGAAARQMPSALARYDATTRQFLQRRGDDPDGLNALERVGELSFVVGDWQRAQAAYVDFAAATADRRRAAHALKYAGDTWWQRQDAGRAAQSYEVARTAAASARDDSLTAVLDGLIPGALYQAAAARDDDADAAVELYERVAHEYRDYEFAPQALYAAAQLRQTSGDVSGAERDYALLVQSYPRHELCTDALLESAAIAEKQQQPEVAAAHLEHLLDTQPGYAERTATHLHIADLFLQADKPLQADRHYGELLQSIHPRDAAPRDSALAADLWMRRARLTKDGNTRATHYARALECGPELSPVDRAEAQFFVTETQRPRYQAVKLSQPIDQSLEKKKQALETLLAGYGATMERGVQPWHAAASLRLGESLAEFGDALRASEPPAELSGDDLWAWQETMGLQAQTLEDRAVTSWSLGLRGARDAEQEDAWTAALRHQLYPLLSQRVPTQPAPMFVLVAPQQP